MFESNRTLPTSHKDYIDPWDLENYAYIRQHLDSIDLNSDPSSSGESSDQYYQHHHQQPSNSRVSPRQQQLDSFEPHSSNYAAIEEIMESYRPPPMSGNSTRRRSECTYRSQMYQDRDEGKKFSLNGDS